ncbi:MAG: hypothetical protein DYG90_00215 [Chloroflexi bacterium CFX6]|nr:hypothetical protein [Chloroflexi bacterium CFX6]
MFLVTLAAALAAVLWSALFQADTPFPIPEWLVGVLPVINYVLNEAIIRFGGDLSSEDKSNLVYAVSIALVSGLVLLSGTELPSAPPGAPTAGTLDVIVPYLLALGAWALFVLGWAWKGAVAIHDTLSAMGKRLSGPPAPAASVKR